jgi:hypothetical protein
MSDFREIKYPIKIQFRTNEDSSSDWGYDMSKYITSFTVNNKVEDKPFLFVENEIRIDFWDFDGGFIQNIWSENITEVEIRFIDSDGIKFLGYLEIPSFTNKNIALGIERNTNRGTLYFGTNLKKYNNTIHLDDTIHANINSDNPYILYTPRGERFLGKWALLKDLLSFVAGDLEVDYSDLPINTDDTTISGDVWVNINYFKQQKKENTSYKVYMVSVMSFLKDVAKLYNSYVYYDYINKKLIFKRKQKNTDDFTLLDFKFFKYNRKVKNSPYSGIFMINPNPVDDNISRYTKYDSNGNFLFDNKKLKNDGSGETIRRDLDGNIIKTTVDSIFTSNDNEETYLIGEKENALEVNINLLSFITKGNDYDTLDDSSTYYRFILRKYLIDNYLQYLSPIVTYELISKKYIPTVGNNYKLSDMENLDGYISSLNYVRTNNNEEINFEFTVIKKFEAEFFYL